MSKHFTHAAFGPSDVIPTLRFQTFAEFRLGLPVWPQGAFGVELVGHGGRGDHSLQAPLALGHVLLRMEQHHVDLGHVEHSQGDGCTEAHRDGQGCGLDVHLQESRDTELKLALLKFSIRLCGIHDHMYGCV